MIRAKLEEIFAKELGLSKGDFGDDLAYNSVPEWDSTSHMSLVLAIEEAFAITLDSDDIVRMTSVGKIIELLSAKGLTGASL